MSIQFAVLASGSRGNSTFVCGSGAGLLIDVGIGPKLLGERLESIGSSWARVAAVVLTHTHADHVDTATFGEMARRSVAIHCHDSHRADLAADSGFQKLEAAGLVRLYDEHPFLCSNGLRLEPIALRHDGRPTYGFRLEAAAERGEAPVCLGYIADTGCWSDSIAETLTGVDLLGVEFNHDVAMQRASKRPDFLIERNLSDDGHLSNRQGALLVEAIINRSCDRAPRHVVLLHLSEQCNHPELALAAAREALRAAGKEAEIHAARQSPAFPNLYIKPSRARTRAAASPRPARGGKQPAQNKDSFVATGLFRWDTDEA
jgi:phosphoribosyl 1,2-cyclic phosphodiesterase